GDPLTCQWQLIVSNIFIRSSVLGLSRIPWNPVPDFRLFQSTDKTRSFIAVALFGGTLCLGRILQNSYHIFICRCRRPLIQRNRVPSVETTIHKRLPVASHIVHIPKIHFLLSNGPRDRSV